LVVLDDNFDLGCRPGTDYQVLEQITFNLEYPTVHI